MTDDLSITPAMRESIKGNYDKIVDILNKQKERQDAEWKKYLEEEQRRNACWECEEKEILIAELREIIKQLEKRLTHDQI